MNARSTTPRGRTRGAWRRWATPSVLWLVPANVLLFVTLVVTQKDFVTATNFRTLMSAFAVTAVVALSQMVVIAAGGMNLAVGAIGAAAGLFSSFLMANGAPVWVALLVCLATGLACGALNGWIVAQFGLSSFIVTLATASVFTGITLGLTASQPIVGLPAEYRQLGQGTFLGIPYVGFFFLAAALLVYVVFFRLGVGRQILAYGGNPGATDLAGVPRWQIQTAVHGISGLLAALAGWMLLAQIGQGQPDIGSDWLLGSFAGPIIGGTLLAGGSMSILGTCLAVALLTQVSSAVIFIGLDPFWVLFLQGAIIVVAAVLDRLRIRDRPARRAPAAPIPDKEVVGA